MNQILVMSSDPILKRKNLEVLVGSGFQVADVSDALDGLLMVDKDGFSAIVIDEELADIDGYRACQKIRQYSQIPIVLLGTEPSEEVWARVDELGFDIYLKKPVSPRELVAQIKSVIRRTRYEEKPKPSKLEKPLGLQNIPVTPTEEIQTAKLGKTIEYDRPVQVERPAEVHTTPIIPVQEVLTRRIDKAAEIEEEIQIEKPAETLGFSDIPLQEAQSVRLDKTTQPEPMIQKERPVGVPPTRIVTILEETKSMKLEGPVVPTTVLTEVEEGESTIGVWSDARMTKLVVALATGRFTEIHPVIDVSAKGGFAYPEVDRLIGATGDETRLLLESLAKENVMNKNLFEKVHVDPDGSVQLVPVERCPHCGSGNLIRGQLIEHFSCGNVGMEQDYKVDHKYTCPKCQKELKLLGTDYRNVGIRYRCLDCNEIFPTPVIKWRNMTSGKIWTFEELQEIQLYSYSLSPDKKDWLEFQLKPKTQLVDFLRLQGYHVEEMAKVHGGSGAVHTINILASRDDGLAKYYVGVGILIASRGQAEVVLEELFEFDTKAYDMGLNYKVVIVIPKLSREAAKFAERQKIGVFEASDPSALISFLNTQKRSSASVLTRATAHYMDQMGASSGPRAKIAAFLRNRGYDVFERARVPGKSGAEHTFDIFAQRDDVIVKPAIAIEVVIAEKGQVVGIDKVSQFDAEAFDAGIRNKVFVGIPQIAPEAEQFAKQQRIKTLGEYELAGLISS
jgi:CheY-like chemotaxis protein